MGLNMKLKPNGMLAAVVLIASALLSGCATQRESNDGRYSWQDGWREGTVIAVGEGSIFTDKLAKNCRNMPVAQSARYATISYRPVTGRIWLTVPIPVDSSLKQNDSVVVNVLDCGKSVERRSS